MKKIKYLIMISIVASLSIVSCDDFLDEKIVSEITSEYLSTLEGLNAGVNGCYNKLVYYYGQEEGGNLSVMGTDIYTHGGHGGNHFMDKYDAELNSESNNFWVLWSNFYIAINTCNAVVERAKASTEMADAEKNPKIAEARFLRAHYYFILVQYFGPVPLSLEETVGIQTEAVRAPESDVYDAIVADLEFAVENLPIEQNDFGRATRPAAKHMLALVHLTRGNYSEAATLAKSVINDYGLELDSDPLARYDHDMEEHKEILWSVQFSEDPLLVHHDNSTNQDYGNETHLYFRPWYETYNDGLNRELGHGYGRPWIRYRPTAFLLNCFRVNGKYDVDSRFNLGFQQIWYYNSEAGIPIGASVGDTAIFLTGNDLSQADVDAIEARLPGIEAGKNLFSWNLSDRNEAWSMFKYLDDATNTSINIFPTPWKFEDNKRPSVNYQEGSRDFIVYSLPETYLIAAEALHLDGKNSEAVEFINAIRRRAAYPGKESEMEITDAEVTIDFILDERARELYGEYKRWLDLKRTGKLIERYKLYNEEGQRLGNIDAHHLLRPIPEKQISRTSNDMEQNDGY